MSVDCADAITVATSVASSNHHGRRDIAPYLQLHARGAHAVRPYRESTRLRVCESDYTYRFDRSRTQMSWNIMWPLPPECSCSAMAPSNDFGLGSVKSTIVTPLSREM